jgi:hypothetical protein
MKSTLGRNKKQISRVLRFFFDIESNDIDYDVAMSAVSIVSALLISIPFALLGVFDDSWYQDMVDSLQNCPTSSMLFVPGNK